MTPSRAALRREDLQFENIAAGHPDFGNFQARFRAVCSHMGTVSDYKGRNDWHLRADLRLAMRETFLDSRALKVR